MTPNACVCPAWASGIEDIKLFQRVKVPYVGGVIPILGTGCPEALASGADSYRHGLL
ncbi:hypothetical protein [Algoriphagus aquimarinus]|uniref:hypothetical protein n=1 Tax=Algoriphagus aquimarinus TaxID=237018 RepID=UPI0030DCA245